MPPNESTSSSNPELLDEAIKTVAPTTFLMASMRAKKAFRVRDLEECQERLEKGLETVREILRRLAKR